jgi:hypothetical protein
MSVSDNKLKLTQNNGGESFEVEFEEGSNIDVDTTGGKVKISATDTNTFTTTATVIDNASGGARVSFGGNANTIINHYNIVGGSSVAVKGSYNIAGGLANNVNGSYNIISGTGVDVYGNYNNLSGYSIKQDKADTSNYSLGGGSSITYNGECQVFGGKNHLITGKLNAIFGEDNDTYGTHNIAAGAYHDIGTSADVANYNGIFGYNNTITGDYNLVGGYKNTVSGNQNFASGMNNKITHALSACIGHKLTSTANGQLVVGQDNETGTKFSNDALVVGYGNGNGVSKTLFTVSKTASGNATNGWYTKPSKYSDAITYGYLQEALLNGEW